MSTLLYLHGFLSSPQSDKAIDTQKWLLENHPEIKFHCPFLTPYFGEMRIMLETFIQENPTPVYIMGSSLGGYWATYLAEKYNLRAILVNPLVDPHVLDRETYVGVELKNYHTEDTYVLNEQHVEELLFINTPEITRHDNYYLMVQTGDESLDYQLAVKKYNQSKQLVIDGGDHSFQDYLSHLPAAIEFLFEK
jgi:predicted esterase YcpF (UPF0227 family)